MIKEMYVSSTPHETKVAVTEDDQLAEIFFERENEYTLAGSIYKGRVTRVLPGMQSAFVDIGLERDAFLYVSDFLDLGELDEDEIESVPVRAETYVTNKPPQEAPKLDFLKQPEAADATADVEEFEEELGEVEEVAGEAEPAGENAGDRQFRGGRRRRGRGRGRGFPETKFARTYEARDEEPQAEAPQEFEPIVLPGESLSKYQRAQRAEGGESEREGGFASAPEPRQEFRRERRDERPRERERFTPEREREEFVAAPDYTPTLLPGESLRKYRKPAETPAEVTAADTRAAEVVQAPAMVDTTATIEPELPRVEHPAPAPQDVVSSFMLPGESLRKYQQRDKAEPDSPKEREESVAVEPAVQPEAEEEAKPEVAAEPVAESKQPESAEPTAEVPAVGGVIASGPEKAEEKPAEEPTEASARVEAPAAISPFVLPGETIRKYTRRRKTAAPVPEPVEEVTEEPLAEATEVTGETVTEETEPQVASAEEAGETAHDEPAAVKEVRTFEKPSEAPAAEAFVEVPAPVAYSGDYETESAVPEMVSDEVAPEAELAEARPHVEEDEAVTLEAPEQQITQRKRATFEPAERGTIEHEEIEAEDLPDDEHEFRRVAEVGTYDDALFEELEETTLAPQAAEAIEEGRPDSGSFVIEGGYDFEEQGAGADEATPEADEEEGEEEEFDEADAAQEEAEAAVQPGARPVPQRGRFDRRRGRRGGQQPRRGNGRPPRRDFQRHNIQISDLLKEGQEVLIQIAKEPIGKKGARITSHIALPGRFLVYMPTVNHIGVSRKINSDEERQRLKRIMISEREGGHGGFIVRTAAAGITEEELRADIRFLKNLWHEIKTRADNSKSPALIYHDLNLVERVLRDQVTSDFRTIWVDTESEYERILRFANRFQPALVRKVKLYTKDTPLYEQFGIQDEINKALKSKVWLKSGGYIVINQTEALVAIDINTGKYVGKTTRLEDTIVKTNVDAIKEIVRQIRLRDLGGIIVIDFIDMDERKNRQKVMQALEEALKADRAPSKVLQFNDFGLVAITRKRVKQSLERTLGAPCPHCSGNGFVKAVNTMCNEIFIEARKLTKHIDKEDVVLRCNPEVAKALKGGRWINEMEEMTGRNILIKSDPLLHEEQFDFN